MNTTGVSGRCRRTRSASSRPPMPGHHHVGEQDVDRPVEPVEEGEGLGAACRSVHFVPVVAEDADDELAHDVLVLRDEDDPRCRPIVLPSAGSDSADPVLHTGARHPATCVPASAEAGRSAAGRCRWIVGAQPGSALDTDEAPALAHGPIDARETQAGPSPCGFVVKNGSKARAAVSASMPSPMSATETTRSGPARPAAPRRLRRRA